MSRVERTFVPSMRDDERASHRARWAHAVRLATQH
jgi:hypothetical protein